MGQGAARASRVKRCTRCRREKPVADFYPYRNGSPRARCKRCTNEVYKDYARRRPEVIRRAQRTRQTPAHRRLRGDSARWAHVLRRDPCSYCEATGGQVDHIDPVIRGGSDHWENLTSACPRCNQSKHAKPLLFFMLELVEVGVGAEELVRWEREARELVA